MGMTRPLRRAWLFAVLLLGTASLARGAGAQRLSDLDRERGRLMLRQVRADLEKHYYDSTYRGMNLPTRFATAEARIDTAGSNGEVFGIIAQLLSELDDSHTFFIPPERAARVEYGWGMGAIGDTVYVTTVRAGSDAARQGLAPGDQVTSFEGYTPTRQNLWKLRYLYGMLRPQPALRITVRSPDGGVREMTTRARIIEGRQRYDVRSDGDLRELILEAERHERKDIVRVVDDVMIWRMVAFRPPEDAVDRVMKRARGHRALVIDLRGNPGGRLAVLRRLVGHFFDRDVLVAVDRRRAGTDSIWARPRGTPFSGRLVVLVDSHSGSSSELFARVMQLHERGTVIGDSTAGAVMGAFQLQHQVGTGRVVFYEVSVTSMDVRAADGTSLEGRGVMPDEVLVPTAADLFAGRDPVLARAVGLAGGSLSAVEAATLFAEQDGR
jgi:carboxyl-terminal processing protease